MPGDASPAGRLHAPPDAPSPLASLSTSQARDMFRALGGLYFEYRDLLPPPLKAALKDLHDRLSERLCPYPAAQLDARVKELNERFPDYEHYYIRSGSTVTWCNRKKDKPPASAGDHDGQ